MSTLVEDQDVHDNIIEAEKLRTKGFKFSGPQILGLILRHYSNVLPRFKTNFLKVFKDD